jgi:uncharacterized phiE125 gp8 family phage protein
MAAIVVLPPSAEPVTLDEAKTQLRQNVDDDDAAITRRIRSARQWAETQTSRAIPAQTFEETFDEFPCFAIKLANPPLQYVESIAYVDPNGDEQTWSEGDYQVSSSREPGLIVPAYGKVFPSTRRQLDAVTVRYVAGWPCTTVAAGQSSGEVEVEPDSMAGIKVGSVLTIDEGTAREAVVVTAIDDDAETFTATFAANHEAGFRVSGVPEGICEAILMKIEETTTGDEATLKAAESMLLGFWYGGYI